MSLYEHFPVYPDPDAGDVPMMDCPTCRGKGLLSSAAYEGQAMVTFATLNDRRLKPKRTWLYIVVGIGFVATASFLAGFFIYPRPMQLILYPNLPQLIYPKWSSVNTDNVTFVVTNSWVLSNPSYFSVDMRKFEVQLSWSFQPTDMKPLMVKNFTSLTIPARSSITLLQDCRINFSGELGYELAPYCLMSAPIHILTTFQAVATVDIRGIPSAAIITTFQDITCYNKDHESTK